MKHTSTQTILDESGIELVVNYSWDRGEDAEYELRSVELIIGGTGLELVKLITRKQEDWIVKQLDFEPAEEIDVEER